MLFLNMKYFQIELNSFLLNKQLLHIFTLA